MITLWSRQIAKFQSDEKGAVAIVFGLTLTATLFLAGMALDYSRITNVRERVVAAVDSASLAAGRAMLDGKLNDGEIQQLAITYINENVKPAKKSAAIGAPVVKIDRQKGSVDIDVATEVNMTLSRIGGFSKISVPVTSSAVFQQRDIEVGMALDITGSMGEVQGGVKKITALKSAFSNFADKLIPTQPNPANRVRIGVAPYAANVNLGTYAAAASQNQSKDGCVVERKNGQYSDGTDPFYVLPAPNKTCPSNAILPLSDDKDMLVNYVNQFREGGSTAGHLGVQWAWNLVSDKWAGTWGGDSAPDPYSRVTDGKLLKAVVLMTDGQFNTQYHGAQSSQQAVALCQAMKDKGVVVFSVGFGLGGDATALATLKACATPGSDYFANASSPGELDAAFSKFAGALTALRIAK
jgi:Flp pilus assembly protein TadG